MKFRIYPHFLGVVQVSWLETDRGVRKSQRCRFFTIGCWPDKEDKGKKWTREGNRTFHGTVAKKTNWLHLLIFPLSNLPCLPVFLSPLSALNQNVKNLPLSGSGNGGLTPYTYASAKKFYGTPPATHGNPYLTN